MCNAMLKSTSSALPIDILINTINKSCDSTNMRYKSLELSNIVAIEDCNYLENEYCKWSLYM